jgi:hypothetical protein
MRLWFPGIQPPGDPVAIGRSSYRVAIVHNSVPQYSVPFLTHLIAAAEEEGIHIDVFAGATPSAIRAREDSGDATCSRAQHS